MSPHYIGLFVAYTTAVGGWLLIAELLPRYSRVPRIWSVVDRPTFERPAVEFALAIGGAVGVLLVGQLWIRGWKLPDGGGLGPVFGAVNQVAIFLPILAVPLLRRNSSATFLLPPGRVFRRLGVGVLLAIAALTAYWLARPGLQNPLRMLIEIVQYRNLDEAVQVFLEDVDITVLLVRLSTLTGTRVAVIAVAALFAAGHIPAMMAAGVPTTELISLVGDFSLGVLLIGAMLRSGDILWFWPIHFTMDLTQFVRITGP